MTQLIEKLRSLPRAARWLVYALAAILGYFAVAQPALDALLGLNDRAANARSELGSEGSEQIARAQAEAQVRVGMSQFGVVAFPGEAAQRSEAFHKRITEVLAKNGVKGDRKVTRTAPMEASLLDAAIDPSRRVDRLIMDLQFNASPEQVSAVLVDLESAPEIASVSRIQLRRESGGEAGSAPGRTLRVNLTTEAWMLSRREAAR